MSNGESVTRWLHGVKARDSADIQRLWNRYFQHLVRLAGKKLPGHCRRAFDEEDVAISAFESFCDRAGRGQFADAFDQLIARLRDQTLRTIALRKLKGDTVEEIGASLGTSTRTIDRKLRLIRAIWEEAAG